jgi:hypothetical protein
MTKHCALSGGPPGGCFASDAAVFSRCRTLRAPIRRLFCPRFAAYPRANARRSVVYGRFFAADSPGFAPKISRWRFSRSREPVPCIRPTFIAKKYPATVSRAGYVLPIVGCVLLQSVQPLALPLLELLRR